MDFENVWIESRTNPLCDVPQLANGGKPTDGGFLIMTAEEMNEFLNEEPSATCLIRPFMMGKDFIDRKSRYCLWLKGISPSVFNKYVFVKERIQNVREFRLKSTKAATRMKADTPALFDEIHEPISDYIAIPKVSSESRKYLPVDYLSFNVIPGDNLFYVQGASIYHFGFLTSCVHNAWMRLVCGRMKSDYRYSSTIVYNNVPWPEATEEQKQKISDFAQRVLDARASHPDWSLADLYHPDFMPQDLRRAHKELDKAVLKLYGLKPDIDEMDIVRHLLGLYKRYLMSV